MGISFRKSIKLLPGVKLNLSKSGPSISLGKSGMSFNVNSKGTGRVSVGLPGTGVSYRKEISLFDGIKKFFGFGVDKEDTVKEKDTNVNREKNTSTLKNILSNENEELVASVIDNMKNLHIVADEKIDWDNVLKNTNQSTENGKYLVNLASRVLNKEEEAYLEVLTKAQPFNDLLEYGTEFEVGIVEDEFMGVSFNINEDKNIPSSYNVSLKSGKETSKEMTKTMRNELIRDYVSSITFRVARDTFSALPILKLVVNAERKEINPVNGHEEDVTILSVIFDREKFETLNFNGIVPYEALKNFEHNIDFKVNSGLNAVLPLK